MFRCLRIVPTVSCSFLSGTYAAVWVGIDGAGTDTVEQIGTDSNCGILGAGYYAWYEFYPQNSVTISDKVSSGDVISAQVIFSSLTELYTLKMSPTTLRTGFSRPAEQSAERRNPPRNGSLKGRHFAVYCLDAALLLCPILGMCSRVLYTPSFRQS